MNEDENLILALSKMEIPHTRKDHTTIENLKWLLRNLGVHNRQHPLHEGTIKILRKRLQSLEEDHKTTRTETQIRNEE